MAKIEVRKGRRSPMPMHKAEKARDLQARLKWLLDFLNTDIDSLSPIEFLKLFLDLGAFVNDPFSEQFEQVEIKTGKGLIKERKFLSICQGILRGKLERILMAEKQIGEESYYRLVDGFGMYVIHYGAYVTKDRVSKFPTDFVAFYRTYEEVETLLIGMNNRDTEAKRKDFYGGLLGDALIRVITRFPLSRIKTCQKPDCGNYFFQKTTKSKGDFCSPKCKNWARTNRWRQNHRGEYNAYLRAYQSERRDKVKQDWVEVYCGPCGFRESRGLLGDYLKSYSGPEDCPQCNKTKLWHIVNRWDKDERDWMREVHDDKEWSRYLMRIQKEEA